MPGYFDDDDDYSDGEKSRGSDSDDDETPYVPIGGRKRFKGGDSDDEEDVNENENEDELNENSDEDNFDENDSDEDSDEDDEDINEDIHEEEKESTTKPKQPAKKAKKAKVKVDDDDDYEEEDPEVYLQKFDENLNKNYILNNHPECVSHNYKEVLSMCKVIRDANGIIIDDFHKTLPYLTKYERAKIIGLRAKQINSGATPFVKLPENIIDGYVIAEMELKDKKIPFIIKRPMPNGGCEYWHLKDLEDLLF